MADESPEDFRNMVSYFWTEKGDPTRYCFWSEERCAKDWPEFLHVWKQHEVSGKVLTALCKAQ